MRISCCFTLCCSHHRYWLVAFSSVCDRDQRGKGRISWRFLLTLVLSEIKWFVYPRLGIIELLYILIYFMPNRPHSRTRRPYYLTSFTMCNTFLSSQNVREGHHFQNHLLNPDTNERGRKLASDPRHTQEPLHEDANELPAAQLGRSWSDRWSFPRSVFDPERNFYLPTGYRWRCTVSTKRKPGLDRVIFISVFAGSHRFRPLLRHNGTLQYLPQNHYQEVKDPHSSLLDR